MDWGVLVKPLEGVAKSKTPAELKRRGWALVHVCDELGWCPVLTDFIDAIEAREFIREYNYILRPEEADAALSWLDIVCDAIRAAISDSHLPGRLGPLCE
jgi:hypothetical protein